MVKAIRAESEKSDSGSSSDNADEEDFHRKVHVTTITDQAADPGDQRDRSRKTDRDDDRDWGGFAKACTHCGSK
uniref:Uncharacterized protein n=1 Tax=Peronospora matthiolae TaxID=2874970 RepID=A0AAV1VM41_9STRA